MHLSRRVKGPSPATACAVMVGALLSGLVPGCSRPGTRLVLITLDTLRYDAFRGSAARPSSMPRLLDRSVNGLRFERCYAATSTTQPSHATILTGQHPWQHGVTRNGLSLGDERTTVAEILGREGFSTSGVVASLPLSRRFGFAQGFDRFDEVFTAGDIPIAWEGSDGEDRYYRLADSVTSAALAEIDRATGERQFFWFHYFDPHAPYGDAHRGGALTAGAILQAAGRGENVEPAVARARDLYDEDVLRLDQSVELVMERLDRDRASYRTHVVILADHGESFGEDGSMAHGKRLTPEQIHVPCLVLSPAVTAAVRRDIAGSIDMTATLLALAGVRYPLPNSRNLVEPAPASAGRPLGCVGGSRQGSRSAASTDATCWTSIFFMPSTRTDEIHTGNSEGMRDVPRDAAATPPALERTLGPVFGQLEAQLNGAEEREADEDLLEGLRALGYLK